MRLEVKQANPQQAGLKLIRLWYSIGALMLVFVGVLSLIPVPDTGVDDKLAHVVTYFMLAGWFSLLAVNRSALVWIVIGLIVYGVLLELLQGLTDFRYAELADNFANASGSIFGVLLYFTPVPRLLEYIDRRLARSLIRRGQI